jgi:hypothetical protein
MFSLILRDNSEIENVTKKDILSILKEYLG